MRLYLAVARRGFRRYATYRGATIAGVFTNTVFGFMRAAIFLAVIANRPVVGGFDRQAILTYTWLGQGLLMVIYLWGWEEVALRIRSGDIATDLSRPYDIQAYWLAQDYGRALYHALFRGLPPFLIAAAVYRLRLPTHVVTIPAFAASLTLAVTVSFALRYLANLSAFWILDYRGPARMLTAAWTFLSGFIVPVSFLPRGLARTVGVLPFAAMFQIPVDIFLEHRAGAAVARGLALQAVWAVLLLAAGRAVLARATRRLVVQGG